MAKDFLIYWKPDTVDRELRRGNLLNHTGSEQLDRVSVGDTLWIVTVRVGKLILVGKFEVAKVTNRDAARRELRYEPWESSRHALAARGEGHALREVPLSRVAADLRFRSCGQHTRLRLTNGTVNAQQLQTMRELTPESALLLGDAWNGATGDAGQRDR